MRHWKHSHSESRLLVPRTDSRFTFQWMIIKSPINQCFNFLSCRAKSTLNLIDLMLLMPSLKNLHDINLDFRQLCYISVIKLGKWCKISQYLSLAAQKWALAWIWSNLEIVTNSVISPSPWNPQCQHFYFEAQDVCLKFKSDMDLISLNISGV